MQLDLDIPDGARAVAVLLHPHPDMGGDRHNHVVGALYLGLPHAGFGAACFDFGTSDAAKAAAQTVTVIDAVEAAAPDAVIAIVGYSFGALVATQITDARIAGWFLIAPPLAHVPVTALATDPRPKSIAVAEHDAYTSPAQVEEITATWTSTDRHMIPDADHFLAGATPVVVDLVSEWLRRTYGTR